MAGPTANRREIRRAFGAGALATLNSQGEALQKLIAIGELHQQRHEAVGQVLADHAEWHEAHKAFRARGFWQRVRWLVTGR